MQDSPEVLIIGAGPTGLMLACQLAIRQIPFRIFEKNEGHNTQSRAMVIHAASMEIFFQMGIASQFLHLGKQVTAINYLVNGKVAKRIPMHDFGRGLTAFPYLLALEQSKTEQLLIAFLSQLGYFVEWKTELISFTQENHQVQAVVRNPESREETVHASWLVGADGSKSLVRHWLDLPLGGETYPMDLFVLDCQVNWPLKNDELYIAFSDHSFAGFFPLPEGRCRLIGFAPTDYDHQTGIRFEDVSNGFADRMQMKVALRDPHWISSYHAHHRYVSQFRKDRCFLAGDAAHIHSPVGAQGMNTGLQDAYNLAWKLQFVIQGKASELLLSTYQEERLPFARQLVKTTDRAFGITVSSNPFIKVMRMYIAPYLLSVILNIKYLARFIFKNLSQIGITYRHSLLSRKASSGSFPVSAPVPGERLPFAEWEKQPGSPVNIQHLIDGKTMVLFLFPGDQGGNNPIEIKHITEIAEKYSGLILPVPIPFQDGSASLYQLFGIKTTGLYLIRPDFYIAYRSNRMDPDHFSNYLNTFLI